MYFIKYFTVLGREDWSLLPSTWYCGEAPWGGSGSCRSPNSVKISQSWEIIWRKAAHLFHVLFNWAPTKVSRAIHRITGCLLVALCQFHLRKICQAGAEYVSVHLFIVQQFISKSFAWPRPEFLKRMNEILGLLLLTQWVKNLAKWVLVGRRLVAGRGALPINLKSSVKPRTWEWECQKCQAGIRNLAQRTESFEQPTYLSLLLSQ